MLSNTAIEFLGPNTATNLTRLLGPGDTESSRAASSLARLTGPYLQALGQSNQSGYKNKPANIGTPKPEGYNKRTARLLAQAKKQGQANNPRITARELQGIIAKAGGGDAFLEQIGGMAGLKRDLGPVARKQFDALSTDYANRNRKTGDDTPQAPVGTNPTTPGQPRSPIPSATLGAYASLYASQLAPGSGARPAFDPVYSGPSGRGATHGKPNRANQVTPGTQEQSDNPNKFLDSFIKVSPKFRNIGNPDVQVGGMSVGNIRMRR